VHLRSLGYRTDLIFPSFEGEILDRGDYLVIRTPSNPTFYWGNFLLFSEPPGEGDFDQWRRLFQQEIGGPPQFKHLAFGWDGTHGEAGLVEPFRKAGFNIECSVVLTAPAPRPLLSSAWGRGEPLRQARGPLHNHPRYHIYEAADHVLPICLHRQGIPVRVEAAERDLCPAVATEGRIQAAVRRISDAPGKCPHPERS